MMKKLLSIIAIWGISWTAMSAVIPGIVKIYDESEVDQLLEDGVSIERRRGDILLCYFPDTKDPEVVLPNAEWKDSTDRSDSARTRGVLDSVEKRKGDSSGRWLNQSKGKTIRPTLDEAVKFFEAWKIQEGIELGSPFTGKGVVVGLCDIGLDPLHPTFLDDNGNSRIKRITQYKEYEGIRIQLEGDEAYKEWKTDSIYEYHATHVAGILAGNGAGSPFRGIATDSEIVASLSCLTSFGLLMGVEDIIEYAKEVGKPAVINLSMGNYIGAHDGTSLFSQYLDLCADDAIIVLSSGNEGNNRNTLSYAFGENTEPLEFRLGNRNWDQIRMYGITDIWNNSDRPLKVTVNIYDDESHTVAHAYEPVVLTDWDMVRYEWNPESPLLEGLSLNGFLNITGGVDPENGRYEVYLMYDYDSSRLIGTGWAKDMISVKVEGMPGDDIDVFADGTYTRLMNISGNPVPNSAMSISDLACGHRVVSVGMYGNRETVPATVFGNDGEIKGNVMNPITPGPLQTVIYSSYGTLRDGRVLPLTVGPGRELVSSVNRHYIAEVEDSRCYVTPDGTPWISEGGTSMSSPYVAGYIATWLEAVPDLSIEDILQLIEQTNSHDIPEPDNPRNLQGYFNPLAALRKVLENNGINQIKDPSHVLLPSDHIEIFNFSGLKIYSGRADGYKNIPKGMYLIRTPFGTMKKIL